MSSTGLCFPLPWRRTTKFFLRSFGPRMCRSLAGNPASRKRCAMASEAVDTLPTESVVLISISCLKMSWESCLLLSSICDGEVIAKNRQEIVNDQFRYFNLGSLVAPASSRLSCGLLARSDTLRKTTCASTVPNDCAGEQERGNLMTFQQIAARHNGLQKFTNVLLRANSTVMASSIIFLREDARLAEQNYKSLASRHRRVFVNAACGKTARAV